MKYQSKRNQKILNILSSIGGFVCFLLIWFLISYFLIKDNNYLLPYPADVFKTMGQLLFTGGPDINVASTYRAIGWSILRIIIGFSVSFVLGGLLGTIAGLHPLFEKFMKPYMTFAKAVPTAAVTLILMALFFKFDGLRSYVPCFLVFLIVFPIIYEAFVSGISNESKDILDSLRMDGGIANPKAITKVLWPDSRPYILLAITQSFGLGMKVSVMAEIVSNSSAIGDQAGIGSFILDANTYAEIDKVIAFSLIVVLIVLLTDIPLHFVKRNCYKELNSRGIK